MDSKTLSDLLKDVPVAGGDGLDTAVFGVAYRSDRVRPGDVFFCIEGLSADGHDFAGAAVAQGAVAIVARHRVDGVDVPQVLVTDPRAALALASSRWFGEPTRRLDVVGITGTNGKTTTAYLVEAVARAAGRATGIIGTVETRIGDERQRSVRTTPESRDLQELFARMAGAGVGTVAMEVSSHAIDLHRVDGVHFAVAAFTNLSQDHLDYHRDMDEYLAVKTRLFTEASADARVVCVDDDAGRRIAEAAKDALTVGLARDAAVRAEDVVLGAGGTTFTLVTPGGAVEVAMPLVGGFNVSNALVAAGCGIALGFPLPVIAQGLAEAPQVPGRLERVEEGQDFAVLVDYAHTPDGLAKAIEAVRGLTHGRVITVFGCGGDRDPAKRPLMGEAAGMRSDVVVVTSDNPRSEDPVGIILQVEDGLRCTPAEKHVQVDRAHAIRDALAMARPGDAVLIAGKGHEDYQIFADRTIHFDDREVAREALRGIREEVGSR